MCVCVYVWHLFQVWFKYVSVLVSLRDYSRSWTPLSKLLVGLRQADPYQSQHLLWCHLESKNHLQISAEASGVEEDRKREKKRQSLG